MSPTARHIPAPSPGPPSTSSMASLAARRDEATSGDFQSVFFTLPRSIRSSHFFLLALTVLVVSTLQTTLFPTATASISYAKFPPHVSQDAFTSLATPVLDSIDSISSPAVIMSCSLILVGTLVRGAENALRSLGSKCRC